jgi:hypothetical protein
MTGMELGSGMQEALSRLESGEDPDAIEASLGAQLENEDPFMMSDKSKKGRSKTTDRPAPRRDSTLHEM